MTPPRYIAKPEGYNLAVLRWFHRGPELRVKGKDFMDGFEERALLPPPTRRQKDEAEEFAPAFIPRLERTHPTSPKKTRK